MHVCMYICICVHACTCVDVYAHMYVYVCTCMWVFMYVCVYVHECVCVCVHSQIGIQGSTYCLVSEGYPHLQKVPDCLSGVEILGSRAECVGVHL